MWVSRVRGHALVRGLTTRVPPPLVARVTRHERALSQAAAEQGGIVPIIEGFKHPGIPRSYIYTACTYLY